jgi:hypothetical protein
MLAPIIVILSLVPRLQPLLTLRRVGVLEEKVGKDVKVGVYDRIVYSLEAAGIGGSRVDHLQFGASSPELVDPPFTNRRAGSRSRA